MSNVKLEELVGGALQEKFESSFRRVLENMLDHSTSFKAKRNINIKLTFEENEQRDDIKVHIDVTEKLAPQAAIETSFMFGRNLKTGEIEAQEYGKQIKGQMSFLDKTHTEVIDVGGDMVDTETGEIMESNVVDLRKKA